MKKFDDLREELNEATALSKMHETRRDLTKISSNVSRLTRSSEPGVATAAKKVEKLIDQARQIIFDLPE